ncbi:MAG: NCS2 family permease [Xanthomonadales bacterium]|nr:NCS2 family permease [Xanthomonadales bacterium]
MNIERLFRLQENQTNVSREAVAGLTTWLAMVYIVVVNPQILSAAGMDFGAVFVATCLAAALGTLLMGLLANYPIALAPGMGLNAFFTYSVVLTMGVPWPVALGCVFWSGVIFLLISVSTLRERVINAIPRGVKTGTAIGIGLFLAVIGMGNAGLIEQGTGTLLTLGDVRTLPVALTTLGFSLIVALHVRGGRWRHWAVISGVLAVSVASWLLDETSSLQGVFGPVPSLAPTLFAFEPLAVFELGFVVVILALLFTDFFDTSGTLVAVVKQAGFERPDGTIPRLNRALIADSGATIAGSMLGTSTTTSYIESSAGIAAGGRTGLTSVVVSGLFLLTLFLSPLAASIPVYATAPALLYVAILLVSTLREYTHWEEFSETAPMIVAALVMPLTYSIADGIAASCLVYVLVKVLSGQARDISPIMAALALLFLARFLFLG